MTIFFYSITSHFILILIFCFIILSSFYPYTNILFYYFILILIFYFIISQIHDKGVSFHLIIIVFIRSGTVFNRDK